MSPARFESYAAAKEQLFDYIEVFYNQQLRRSALGDVLSGEEVDVARVRTVLEGEWASSPSF